MVIRPINSGLTAIRTGMLMRISTRSIEPPMKCLITDIVTFPRPAEHSSPDTFDSNNFGVTTTFYPPQIMQLTVPIAVMTATTVINETWSPRG